MKAKFENAVHVEGLLYDHDLVKKVSGPNSKNPGTEYISGTVKVATDNACVNVVEVHYTYATAQTKNGPSANYTMLENIINGTYKTVMSHGKDVATKLRIDSSIGLNEFYATNRTTNEEELVSAKRNEGGFIHVADVLNENEDERSKFKVDMLITNVRRVEATETYPEKVVIKGFVFDFRRALLPVEFEVYSSAGMDYFEDLGAGPNNPVLTNVWGNMISTTVVKRITEESAFGEDYVKEVKNTRKVYEVKHAAKFPYVFDDESTMTVDELKKLLAEREVTIAGIKSRREEYKASQQAPAPATVATTAAPATTTTFNF